MAYRVVKKINGCYYLYEQETYREGGKVRTRSQYIGPVDGKEYHRMKKRGEPLEALMMAREVPKDASQVEPNVPDITPSTEPLQTSTPQKAKAAISTEQPETFDPLFNTTKSKQKLKASKPVLKIRAKVERHKISRSALIGEHNRFLQHMSLLGLDTTDTGRVLIGYGRHVRCKRRKTGNYVITLPRWKVKAGRKKKGDQRAIGQQGVRTVFKREYRKALAGTYLDAIQVQQPKYYAGLEQNLKAAFKNQNRAIARYILNSKRSDMLNAGLTLHFLQSKMLSNWSKAHIAPEKVGFVDHSQRSTWRNAAVAIMSEIQKQGWNTAYIKYMEELNKAEALTLRMLGQYRKAGLKDRLSGKRRAKRREFLKYNARRKALVAACDKISVLAPLYQGFKSDIDGSMPFVHESNWQNRKNRWHRRHSRAL